MAQKFNQEKFDADMNIIEKLMNPKTAQKTLDELKENITDIGDAYNVHMFVTVVNDWKNRRDYMMSILPKKTLKRFLEIEERING